MNATDTIEEAKAEAARRWAYFPFRRCWIAIRGTEYDVILKADARVANAMARDGWQVFELSR